MKKWILVLSLVAVTLPLFSQDSAAGSVKEDALVLYRNGQYERAIEVCLRELDEYAPEQVNKKLDAYTVMCWSLLRLKRYDEAIARGKEALSVFPYDQRIIETLGEAYFFKGDNLNALSYFEQYAVLNPTGQWIQNAYYYMGEIYIRLGEFAHADIAFSTALYHSPHIARWWSRLGYAMEREEDRDGAIKAYKEAVRLKPDQEDALLGLERLQAN